MDNTLLYVMYVNTGNLSPCMMHDHRHRRSGGVVQPTVQLVGQLKNQYWSIGQICATGTRVQVVIHHVNVTNCIFCLNIWLDLAVLAPFVLDKHVM